MAKDSKHCPYHAAHMAGPVSVTLMLLTGMLLALHICLAFTLPNPMLERLMSLSDLCPFHGPSSNLYVQSDLSAVESPVPLSGSSCPIKHTPLFVSVQTLCWIFNSLCLGAPFHKFSHVVVWTLLRTLSDGKPLPSRGVLLLL